MTPLFPTGITQMKLTPYGGRQGLCIISAAVKEKKSGGDNAECLINLSESDLTRDMVSV